MLFHDRDQYLSASFWLLEIFEVSTIESGSIAGEEFDLSCQREEFLLSLRGFLNSFFVIDKGDSGI